MSDDTALSRYKRNCVEGEPDTPIERLRFFLSMALAGQDWLDVEQFLDELTAERDEALAKIERLEAAVRIAEAHEAAEKETTVTLGKQVDDLTRNLTEQQASIRTALDTSPVEHIPRPDGKGIMVVHSILAEQLQNGEEELNKLLAEERKKAVPSKLAVLNKPIGHRQESPAEIERQENFVKGWNSCIDAMLSAAPQPEDK